MKDLAILIDNKNDSTEAQDLLFSMGYKWRGLGEISKSYFYPKMNKYFIFMNKNEMDLQMAGYFAGSSRSYAESRFKEITLAELRDLVVLKRNDLKDANVSEENCLYDLYLTKSKELYFYHCGKNKWILSNLNGDDDYYELLKPIEKPMKEYLRKNSNGTYSYIGMVQPENISQNVIEIPEGATYYAKDANLGKSGNFFFRLRSDGFDFEAVWLESNWMQASFNVKNQEVLWQRHTLPEELPFIDDEPIKRMKAQDEAVSIPKSELDKFGISVSLNDKYAEIEKVRQSQRKASETSNPTIKETLNQRQEQYGSFEDVAMITEQMVDVMRRGYYENLAYNQKMAIYMICSKMARIVNGNPNHKDSWHDIAGYATLIDSELVSEKDMPF